MPGVGRSATLRRMGRSGVTVGPARRTKLAGVSGRRGSSQVLLGHQPILGSPQVIEYPPDAKFSSAESRHPRWVALAPICALFGARRSAPSELVPRQGLWPRDRRRPQNPIADIRRSPSHWTRESACGTCPTSPATEDPQDHPPLRPLPQTNSTATQPTPSPSTSRAATDGRHTAQ